MESTTPPRATLGAPRVRDRVVRHVTVSVTVPDSIPTGIEGYSFAPHRAAAFFPNALRIAYIRHSLDPAGAWDVEATVTGPIERADGTPGKRTATRLYAYADDDTDPKAQDWPAWLVEVVSTLHPVNLPTVPQ